ncbi:sigma-70 family RNA polymerase sigma factor [bacterium]|nr:MAG: sigma-70 family RNA polymerase sigma factor [bacterium]
MNQDLELVKLSKTNPEYFGLIYDKYFDRIYRFFLSRLGNVSTSEDLTSTTWLKVVENLSHFEPSHENSFVVWLFAISRNTLFDYYKANKIQFQDLYSEEKEEYLSSDENLEETVFNNIELAQFKKSILIYLSQLPPSQNECIRLRYLEELTNKEISTLLSISEKTVSAHIARGLKQIRRFFGSNL